LKGHGQKFTRLAPIAAQSRAAGLSYTRTASVTGVSRRTVLYWGKLVEFHQLREAATQRLRAAELLTLENAKYAKHQATNGESAKAEQDDAA
jgi:hypothetical protein